jgi:hypothetical protein
MDIPIATAVSIREAGFDEYWLRDQIYPKFLMTPEFPFKNRVFSQKALQSRYGTTSVLTGGNAARQSMPSFR